MPKAGVVGGIFGVLLIGAIVYLSLGFDQLRCEVCMDFQGRTQCRTASGANEHTAVQTAKDNACAYLVHSKTEGFLCSQTTPARVTCQDH
jgi:hypothetical protein